jgi:hypothetical protein
MRIRGVCALAALADMIGLVNLRIVIVGIVITIGIVITATTACGGSGLGLFRQYEYEEEIYLSLDGTATVNVNSSIAALNALHGTSFDTSPIAHVDTRAITDYFSTPTTHVTRVATSRRSNRRFVHVRMEIDDVRRLSENTAFRWSTYEFMRDNDEFTYRQMVGPSAAQDVGAVGWNGRELVAFRLHLPSKITFHNTKNGPARGNILAWEQPLAERLQGEPLTLEARMERESILFRTLWLFAATFVAVAVTFALVIWWVMRRSPKAVEV